MADGSLDIVGEGIEQQPGRQACGETNLLIRNHGETGVRGGNSHEGGCLEAVTSSSQKSLPIVRGLRSEKAQSTIRHPQKISSYDHANFPLTSVRAHPLTIAQRYPLTSDRQAALHYLQTLQAGFR